MKSRLIVSNVSKEGKKKHLIQLWIDEDKWQQIRRAADTVQEPITGWVRRAVFGALRRWEVPEVKTLYEPCPTCGEKHDPKEHFHG